MLWTEDLDVARSFVLAGGGQYLRTLIVGLSFDREKSGTQIADDFLCSCPHIKSLSVHASRGVFVSKFGYQAQ